MTSDTFFTELKKLLKTNPKTEGQMKNCEDCSYSHNIYDSKNLIYSFDSSRCKNGIYIFDGHMCVDSADCDYTVEADSCYECSYGFKCFNCTYITQSDRMRDCHYCYDCSNLENCFGCVCLKNKSYCIFNRQLTESQYKEEIKKYQALPAEQILTMVSELEKRFPIRPNSSEQNENSPYGNFIYYSKNCYMCFDAAHDEECCYMYDSFDAKYSMDHTYSALHCDNAYQVVDTARITNGSYIYNSNTAVDCDYIFDCLNVKNCLGCVGLSHKEYCILNRQFTKEDYEKMLPTLKKAVFGSGIGWDLLKP